MADLPLAPFHGSRGGGALAGSSGFCWRRSSRNFFPDLMMLKGVFCGVDFTGRSDLPGVAGAAFSFSLVVGSPEKSSRVAERRGLEPERDLVWDVTLDAPACLF